MSKKTSPAGPQWVRNAQLAQHFNVSAMCIWRWKRDPALGCPPSHLVNDLEYNNLADWDAWMLARAVSRIEQDQARSRRAAPARAKRQA